jgi:ribonuclease HII
VVDPEEIDRLNIFGATMLAMTLAVEALLARIGEPKPVREVRVDGNLTPQGRCAQWLWPARAIVGAMRSSRASRQPRSSPRNTATA